MHDLSPPCPPAPPGAGRAAPPPASCPRWMPAPGAGPSCHTHWDPPPARTQCRCSSGFGGQRRPGQNPGREGSDWSVNLYTQNFMSVSYSAAVNCSLSKYRHILIPAYLHPYFICTVPLSCHFKSRLWQQKSMDKRCCRHLTVSSQEGPAALVTVSLHTSLDRWTTQRKFCRVAPSFS